MALPRLFLRAGLFALCLSAVLPQTVTAQDLGPLNEMLSVTPPPGWQLRQDGNVTVLRNDGAAEKAHFLIWEAGPAPQPLRSSLLTFNLNATSPETALIFLIGNAEAGDSCFLSIYGSKNTAMICDNGQGEEVIASVTGVAKFDGSDRLQVIEEAGGAVLLLNEIEVGRLAPRPALGGVMGVVASGPGEFYLGHFSIYVPKDEAAPATENRVPDDQMPDRGLIDAAFSGAGNRPGWQSDEIEGGWQISNPHAAGDERLVPLALPVIEDQARVVAVDVTLTAPPAGAWSARAAGGLFWENAQTGQSCSVQITAGGDGIMVCFTASGRAVEIGRLPGAARGPGPHTLAVVESGTDLIGLVGTERVGYLQGHPSLGGAFSLYGYERGVVQFTDLTVENIRKEPDARPAETRRPQVSMGAGLDGPLPMFGGDPDRAAAAYLGITRSIFLHELGHALIGELAVPSTGPEEDAVDIYSALQMADAMAMPVGHPVMDRIAPQAAGYAALAWYYSGRLAGDAPPQEGQWQDEHTADLKRFRNMFCVIYGANPAGFGGLAEAVKMEERTLARCEEEFRKQSRAWRAILSPYTRISADNPEALLPARAPGAEVVVELLPSRRQVGEYLRQTYGDVLRETALGVGRSFALKRPLKITYKDCDVVNAWYAPAEGSITMCYEIVEHFAVLISDIEEGTRDGYEQMASAAPGQPQAPQSPQAPPAPPAPKGPDELADAGIPATLRLFAAPYQGPTPNSHARAGIITSRELVDLLQASPGSLIIDVREGEALQSLPGAMAVPGLGGEGSLIDGLQGRVENFAASLTGGQKDLPLIITGAGPQDRAAYNAALRIATAGYKALWYRGGLEAWTALGLPLAPLE